MDRGPRLGSNVDSTLAPCRVSTKPLMQIVASSRLMVPMVGSLWIVGVPCTTRKLLRAGMQLRRANRAGPLLEQGAFVETLANTPAVHRVSLGVLDSYSPGQRDTCLAKHFYGQRKKNIPEYLQKHHPKAHKRLPLGNTTQPLCNTMQPLCSIMQPLCSIMRPPCSMTRPLCSIMRPLCSIMQPLCTLKCHACAQNLTKNEGF